MPMLSPVFYPRSDHQGLMARDQPDGGTQDLRERRDDGRYRRALKAAELYPAQLQHPLHEDGVFVLSAAAAGAEPGEAEYLPALHTAQRNGWYFPRPPQGSCQTLLPLLAQADDPLDDGREHEVYAHLD